MKNFYLYFLSLSIMIGFCFCHDNSIKKEKFEEQFSKANALYTDGDYKSALRIYDLLIKRDSLNGEIYYKRGYCKVQTFDPRLSKEDFENAIKFGYRIKDSYVNLGIIECFYNDSLAIKYFDIALRMDSNDTEANMYRDEAMKRLRIRNKIIDL